MSLNLPDFGLKRKSTMFSDEHEAFRDVLSRFIARKFRLTFRSGMRSMNSLANSTRKQQILVCSGSCFRKNMVGLALIIRCLIWPPLSWGVRAVVVSARA